MQSSDNPILRMFLRRKKATQTPNDSLSPFQQLSLQAYGRQAAMNPHRNAIIIPVQPIHPSSAHPNGRGRGDRGVQGAETDQAGRRNDSVNPVEHEGIEKEVLPAYDSSLKRPPRYQELMRSGDSGSIESGSIPYRHPADRLSFEEEEEEVIVSPGPRVLPGMPPRNRHIRIVLPPMIRRGDAATEDDRRPPAYVRTEDANTRDEG